jgi:hypothetical protein
VEPLAEHAVAPVHRPGLDATEDSGVGAGHNFEGERPLAVAERAVWIPKAIAGPERAGIRLPHLRPREFAIVGCVEFGHRKKAARLPGPPLVLLDVEQLNLGQIVNLVIRPVDDKKA